MCFRKMNGDRLKPRMSCTMRDKRRDERQADRLKERRIRAEIEQQKKILEALLRENDIYQRNKHKLGPTPEDSDSEDTEDTDSEDTEAEDTVPEGKSN